MPGDPQQPPAPPRVWLLMGHKAGDNAQVRALADALGWPYTIKQLTYRATELWSNLLLGPTLAGIDLDKSSPIVGPWPELVITAGRRNEPVARWIQRQAKHRVMLVHIGRPWARPERFDLIITTPQYRLADAPNVLFNDLPLQAVTDDRMRHAAASWAPRIDHLPKPRFSLLVGGNSGPFTLDAELAARLARTSSQVAKKHGGSLLVTTSARTPANAVDALINAIEVPSDVFRWSARADENPYYAYLALADAHIVTGDSMSMLAEACATRKPVYIFDMREPPRSAPGHRAPWKRWRSLRFKVISHHLAMRFGPRRMARDISRIHEQLIDHGRATWLGSGLRTGMPSPPIEDLQRARERVLQLFGLRA